MKAKLPEASFSELAALAPAYQARGAMGCLSQEKQATFTRVFLVNSHLNGKLL
ncbi:hypothetical protein V2O64_25385 (plasmid) [Verrucomicrobiaceae bacterium 227]